MADIERRFEQFMREVINPSVDRLAQLDDFVNDVSRHLLADPVIGPRCEQFIPQGSWAYRTMIEPFPNRAFDADILVSIRGDGATSGQPREYLRQVCAALRRGGRYPHGVQRKNRCLRVWCTALCHVDVVPHVVLAPRREAIMNYASNTFEAVDPKGLAEWLASKDALASGNLRLVIQLMKYIRQFKRTFSCPPIILTILLGSQLDQSSEAARYSSLPAALVNIVTDLNDQLQRSASMPTIADPSCPSVTFNHRWSESKYANFRNRIAFYSRVFNAAFHEPDPAKSILMWSTIFGSRFGMLDF